MLKKGEGGREKRRRKIPDRKIDEETNRPRDREGERNLLVLAIDNLDLPLNAAKVDPPVAVKATSRAS